MTTDTKPAKPPMPVKITDPIPSTLERGPIARIHWRHGLDTSLDLFHEATKKDNSPEMPAIMAETHARLLDPDSCKPIARPSPMGLATVGQLSKLPEWQNLADSCACHPSIARDAVVSMAPHIRQAIIGAGAQATDSRKLMDEAIRLRKAAEEARKAVLLTKEGKADVSTPEGREKMKAANDTARKAEGADAALQGAEMAASRIAASAKAGGGLAAALTRAADEAKETSQALNQILTAGLGSALGMGSLQAAPDDLVKLMTREVASMLRMVGALRLALRKGREAKHMSGRNKRVGRDVGGLSDMADLTSHTKAALAGAMGEDLSMLARFKLVRSRAGIHARKGAKAEKGDVLVILDQSGSMSGDRERWAGALALAVILEAREDNRLPALICYSGDVRAHMVIDSPSKMRDAMQAICAGSGGSNNEHRAFLCAAREVLPKMKEGGSRADVLLITDGQWQSSNIRGVKLPEGIKLRAVFIGGECPEGLDLASAWSLDAEEVTTTDGQNVAIKIAQTVGA